MEVKVMVGVPVMPLSAYRLKGFKFDLQRFSEPDGNWSDYAASSFSTIDESAHTITINSAAELALLAKNVNNETNSYSGWTITLGNNIDLGEYYWTPIGGEGYGNAFKGTFDGNGKTVSNVNVQDTIGIGTSGYCFGGFFGYVFGGTIKNLNLNTVGVSSTRGGYIGGLVGNGTNSTIDNCFLYNVTLSGGNYSGGLAGEALRSNITNCFAQSTGGRSGFVDSATRFNNGIDNPNIFYASDSNDSYAKKLFSTSMLPAGVTATYTGNNYYTVTLGGNTFYQTGATFKLSYDGTVPEGYYGVDGLKAYGQPLTKNADGTYTFTVNLENTYKGRAIEYQAQPAITGFPYDSATKTYTISSKDDLKRLSDHVKEGGNTSGLTFKLMADIDDVDFQIGDKTGNSFKGIFDGNGHKITVNISKDNNAALFYRVENGTIKDLTLEGNITAQNQYVAAASSFIDTSGGNVSILNCTSNVSIKSYNSMDSYSGGFVSYNRSGTLNLKNCTFGGKLDVGGYSGGFVGLNESITNVDSCIFMPEAASFNGNSNCATFVQNRRLVAGGNEGFATVKNSYHTQTFGDNPNGSTEIRSQVTEGFTRSSIINGVTVYFASQGLEALVGDGTAENPYQLNGQSSLNKLAEHIRTGGSTAGLHFILTNNFSYGGSIGNTSNPFQGTLDGNGKTLTATGSALFGAIKDATVKNLAISGSISDTAALSNSTVGNVSLDNVYCNSTVSAKNFYGLLGTVDDGATLNFNNVFLRIGTSGRVNLHSPVGSKAGSVSVNGNVYYAYCDFSSADGIKVIEVDIPGGVDVTCNDADKFVRDSTTYYKIGAELNLNADMTKYEFADIPQAVSAGSGKFTYTVAEQNQLSFESYPKINGITFDADSKTYTISNAAELNALAAYVNAGNTCAGYNFKLTADINMSGESFKPIGTEGNSFRGTFDGNGLTISGLTSGDYNYVGLFGENYGTIQNVNLDNVNFNVGTCVGAIAAHNSGSIKNCSASGYVNGMNWVGGLVAENNGGSVQNSFSNVKADSGSSLVGNNQGIVSGCSYVENGAFDSTGSTKLCTLNLPKGIEITCDASKMKVFNGVAYYVPNTEVTLTLTDDFKASYKNSSVGLKGLTQNADGTYKLTVADNVTVEAQGEEVVKGLLFSTADNAFIIETAADLQALANYVNGGGNTLGYNFKVTADIDLKGINFTSIGVGGTTNRFKGNFDGDNHVISNLYVNGNDYVGLFGENYGTIQNVYLLNANVSGNEYVGGLVGYNFRSIQNCFVEGKISGGDTVGAIVGVNIDTVQDCYYHSDADGVGEKVLLLNLPEGVTAQISGETLNVGGKTFCKQGTTVTLDASELKQKYYTLKLSAGDTVATDNGDNTCTLTLDTVDTITAGGLLKIDGLNRFEGGNVLIGSRDELKALADYVENGNACAGYNFKLDQNISGVDFQIGTADTPFRGTLDGDNHSISATNTLFDYIDNATFKNLTIDGEFSGATFALHSTGSCDFVNCAFIGSLTGEDSCGFVKYNSGNVNVYNCVFAPTSLAVSGGGFTFAENANVTDSYYTQPLDTAQGEQVFSELNLPAGVTAEVINGDTLSIGGNNFYKPGTVFKLTSTLSKTNPYMFKAGNTVSGGGTGGVYQIALGSSNNVEVLDLPDLDGAAYSYDDNSYTLTTNEQIQALALAVNSGFDFKGITIKLANDLSNVDCTVGTVDNPFRGTLDGQGNTLTTSKTLFGYVDGATIKDLSIDGNISGNSYTGGLINCAAGNVSISNVKVNADVSVTSGNTQVVGGIIGNAQDSAVNFTNVNFYGTLTNNQNYAGGFVGWSQGGASLNFDNCFNMGSYIDKGNYYPVAVREQNANVTITDNDLYFSEPATFDDNSYAVNGGSFLYESLRLPAGVTAELVSGDKKTVNGKDYYQSGAVWNITIEDGSVIDEHQLLKAGTATALNIGNDQYQITITNSATLNVADSFEPFGDMTFDYSRNAYLIKTADDLNYLSQAVNGRNNCAGKTFILANDIDMRGVNFTPIGNAQVNYDFAGTFDGNGYTISNLTISDGVNVGLFGYNRGTIRNLNLLLYKSVLKLERVLLKSKRTVFFFQPPCGAVHFFESEDSVLRIFNYEPAEVVSSHRQTGFEPQKAECPKGCF